MTTATRYIAAINMMTKSPNVEVRTWARASLRDMSETGVSVLDYLRPMMTLSDANLDWVELAARKLAGSRVTLEKLCNSL